MQLVFSDAQYWEDFLPLSFTRPVAEMRCGILTFAERWRRLLAAEEARYITEDYLQCKYQRPDAVESLFLVPNFLPTETVLSQIRSLKKGEALVYENELLAARVHLKEFSLNQIEKVTDIEEKLIVFKHPTDLFSLNKHAVNFDFELLTAGRQSQALSETNGFIGDRNDLFIEEGATVEFSTINTKSGKIYIGKNAEVMEGSNLRGPLALCDNAVVKLGTRIYGATTLGPYCKLGGEISNVVIFGYSSKGHDGYLGDSVIGEWCNLGADSNTSNLKNNYATVKLWSYRTKQFENTGLQFCGTIMGDHTKTAINTQINTGTVMGVAANLFRHGFPPNKVASFSWGGMNGDEKYKLEKMFETAEVAMARRNAHLSDADKEILRFVYENYE